MGKLRRRMEEEMRLRGYSARTVETYLANAARFVVFHGRAPEELGAEEIRQYLVHLSEERKLSWSAINHAICSLKFLYEEVLGRPCEVAKVHYQKRRRQKLPVVLSGGEVGRLLTAVGDLKHRAILTTMYSAGLRVGEATRMEVGDLDSEEMRIRVRNAKGGRERDVMLSPRLLKLLRHYFLRYRPERWLFYGASKSRPIDASSVQRVFKRALHAAGIEKAATPHSLRHSFATHLLEAGTNVRAIQELLGHRSLHTTMRYTRVSREGAASIVSPFERIALIRGPRSEL